MHLGADLGGGYPALRAAFPECAPEDGLLGLLGHGDVAGHAKQLEHELLLGKEIGHRWRTSCSYSEGPATPSLATPAGGCQVSCFAGPARGWQVPRLQPRFAGGRQAEPRVG